MNEGWATAIVSAKLRWLFVWGDGTGDSEESELSLLPVDSMSKERRQK